MWSDIQWRNFVSQCLFNREEGQDLVEYALVVGLLSTAVVTALGSVAAPLNVLFNKAVVALTSIAGG
jgi:Flp pilus assembly pilin Flp